MYMYDFENENIILESVDNLVSINDQEFRWNVLLTDLNILLFRNVKKDSVLAGREIHEMPEYELVVKINLKDLKYEIEDNNSIIKYNENKIILYNFDLKVALKK